MRIVTLRPPPHEGDFVVHRLRISTQENGPSAPVLFGDLHPHDVPIKRHHALQIADVDTYVTEPHYACHMRLLPGMLSRLPADLPSGLRLWSLIVMNAVRRSKQISCAMIAPRFPLFMNGGHDYAATGIRRRTRTHGGSCRYASKTRWPCQGTPRARP